MSEALATWVLQATWQVALIVAAALGSARLVRRAAVRHVLLVSALALSVIVPIWSAAARPPLSNAGAPAPAHRALPPAWPRAIAAVAIAAAVLKTIRLARSTFALHRLRATARPHETREGVLLAYSDAVPSPVTLGAFRPVILLPSDRTIDEESLELVLRHELAHVRRRDFALHVLLEWLTVPVAFHPLLPLLKRRIAAAREMACDEIAARDVAPLTYARTLVALASSGRREPALGFGEVTALEERLRYLAALRPARRAAAMTLIAFALITAAALWLARTPPPIAFADGRRDFSGRWQLNSARTDFGAMAPYDSFNQTIDHRATTFSSRQKRIRGNEVESIAWSVETDGITRPIDGDRGRAWWERNVLMLEFAGHSGHEKARAFLSPDGENLICDVTFVSRGRRNRSVVVFDRVERSK